MKKNNTKIDVIVVGFALFAMFFGAGNLIFPPALGLMTGKSWTIGFIFYFIADIGLAAYAVWIMTYKSGQVEDITYPLGKTPSRILVTAVILCIGPGFAIPRTAATTFELAILPYLGIESNKILLLIFSIVFFAVVLLLSIRSSKVVDIIGKVLTPILLVCIAIMIIKGIISPQAQAGAELTDRIVREGIYNGYQTMDMMAALIFTGIIISSFKSKGYTNNEDIKKLTVKSTLLSALLLLVIYGGLTYLGATCDSALKDEMMAGNINHASLLIAIIDSLMGKFGLFIIAIVVAFACLTTAIGLTSSASEYFASITNLSYEKLVMIICIVSTFICNLGLSQIISISGPILQLIYPLITLMIVTALLQNKIASTAPFRITAIVTLIISLIETLGNIFSIEPFIKFISKLPLSSFGFSWLIPAILIFVATSFLARKNSLR